MGKKKKSKKRGSREHGRGRKKGRGAGIRGGRGNAGAKGHRKNKIIKEEGADYFGSHGFTRPDAVVEETVTTNVGDLLRLEDELAAAGHMAEADDGLTVDLDAAGIDKLLGAGRVHKAYRVSVKDATDKAQAKLEAEGGSVDMLEDESSEDADEPSDE